jgi:hypothetical protein
MDNNIIGRYGRWSSSFALDEAIEQVRFVTPMGQVELRPVFTHQPARFHYDEHGYEQLVPDGEPVSMVRYTPKEVGVYHYEALHGQQVRRQDTFESMPSEHPGYVMVSPKDPRYFCFTNGQPYCAAGVNLCGPATYPLPQGMAHFEVGQQSATLGLHEYRRWFRLLSENGGNFTRIWLSNAYFQAETEQAGQVNPLLFNRLDGLIELARQYGIRLKLCFDHFRAFPTEQSHTMPVFVRKLQDPRSGRQAETIDGWLSDPLWQERWFEKVQAYLARYGGDPVVMAWELWNEMDCVVTQRWELVREWTRSMLRRIKQQAPDQLVVNSLGSFDDEQKLGVYGELRQMDEMDFQQVHRYLDQGAPWDICRHDPVAFSIDAIQRMQRPDRPVILAETGAVNDRHTGVFRYCRMDRSGLIFHDTTFPAFFAGAAGSGHIWFWDSYVDQKNLWGQLKPFADLLEGVALDSEGFQPVDLSNEQAWCLGLTGQHTLLLWLRNKADTWQTVLRDELAPAPVDCRIPIAPRFAQAAHWQAFNGWGEEEKTLQVDFSDGALSVRQMTHGVMVRITVKEVSVSADNK